MAFRLLMLAQESWRKLNGAHLLPLVRARVRFVAGVQIERSAEEESEGRRLIMLHRSTTLDNTLMQCNTPGNCQPHQWPEDRIDLARLSGAESEANAAMRALYERHGNWVRRFALGKGRLFSRFEPHFAYDICQEAFLKLFKSARIITAERGLCPWFTQVVKHLLLDWWDKHGRRTEPLPDVIDNSGESECISQNEHPGSDDLSAGIDREKMKDCVMRAFREFRQKHPNCADALLLWTYSEPSYENIAGYFGRTPGATREYLSQCRKKFKPYLKPCWGYISNTEEGSE